MKRIKFFFLILLSIIGITLAEYKERLLIQATWRNYNDGTGDFDVSESPILGPTYLIIEPNTRDIYIPNGYGARVQVFEPTGKLINTLPLIDPGCYKMCFDYKGYKYISRSTGMVKVNKMVYGENEVRVGGICKYDKNWSLVKEWEGTDKKSPFYPRIYAVEKYKGKRPILFHPCDLYDFSIGKSGCMYIKTMPHLVLDSAGKLLYWSKYGDIFEDPSENIYIFECVPGEKRQLAFLGKMNKGKFPKKKIWGKEFPYDDPFVDKDGNIYGFDGNKRVEKFDKNMNLLCEIEVKPIRTAGHHVVRPIIDDDGNIYQIFSRHKWMDGEKESFRKDIERAKAQGESFDIYQKYLENEERLSEDEKNFYGVRVYKWPNL